MGMAGSRDKTTSQGLGITFSTPGFARPLAYLRFQTASSSDRFRPCLLRNLRGKLEIAIFSTVIRHRSVSLALIGSHAIPETAIMNVGYDTMIDLAWVINSPIKLMVESVLLKPYNIRLKDFPRKIRPVFRRGKKSRHWVDKENRRPLHPNSHSKPLPFPKGL